MKRAAIKSYESIFTVEKMVASTEGLYNALVVGGITIG